MNKDQDKIIKIKAELKKLVASNLDSAIDNFEKITFDNKDLHNEIIVLKGRYLDTGKYFNLNIVEKASIDIEFNKVRSALLSLIDRWLPTSTEPLKEYTTSDIKIYKHQFPWSELINKGQVHLFGVKEKLESLPVIEKNEQVINIANEYVTRFQIRNHKEIQLSIINKNRDFVFHNWAYMIGSFAKHIDMTTGVDFYDIIFSYPFGSVSWIDKVSNNLLGQALVIRENIALFTTTQNNLKIVIELHNEK